MWTLAVMARGPRLQAPPSLFPWFCRLCMFQSTNFQIYKCVDLSSILVCWTEHPLLNHGCFTSFRWKERDKGSILLHNDADITTILLICQFFLRFTSTSQMKSLKTFVLALPHQAPNSSLEILVPGEY